MEVSHRIIDRVFSSVLSDTHLMRSAQARYLKTRKDNKNKLFRIGYRQFQKIWKKASKAAGFKITSQVLRKWHSTMLGELMVPDRFVDVFQVCAPRNVLAKHYTGKGP